MLSIGYNGVLNVVWEYNSIGPRAITGVIGRGPNPVKGLPETDFDREPITPLLACRLRFIRLVRTLAIPALEDLFFPRADKGRYSPGHLSDRTGALMSTMRRSLW